jgi:hypothetical protein
VKEKNPNPKDEGFEGFEGKQDIKLSQGQFDILPIGESDLSRSLADPVRPGWRSI